MKRALLLACLVAAPALAADDALLREFPAGSITTREQAARATQAARARADAIEREFQLASQRCASAVLVTGCRTDARRQRDAQLRETERVRLEARDLTRRLDAEERARARAEQAARRAEQAAAKEAQAAQSRATHEARQRAAAPRPEHAPVPRAPKAPAAPHQLSPEQRAENVKRLQEKQRAAADYAQRKAKEREDNARRREQRRQEREAEAKKRAPAQ